jgi:hypothetical protein
LRKPKTPVGNDREHDDDFRQKQSPDKPVRYAGNRRPRLIRGRLLDDDDRDDQHGGDDDRNLKAPLDPLASLVHVREAST